MQDWSHMIQRIAHGWLFSDITNHEFPPVAILPLENPDLHEHSRFTAGLTDVADFKTVSFGVTRGRQVAVLMSKFGAPAVAMTVELLGRVGVKTVVGVGYCGGLRPLVTCGDLVLPLASIRNEGTTPHYVPEIVPAVADWQALKLLQDTASRSGRRTHCGIVWTTDAILRETSALVGHWAGHGALAVDMESSALLTVARFCGIRAAAILVASDNPAAGVETELLQLRAGMDSAIAAALTFAAEWRNPELE